jgi:hypothetical protein
MLVVARERKIFVTFFLFFHNRMGSEIGEHDGMDG